MDKKVLITTPDTSMFGGVAAFYKSVSLNAYSNIDYFFVQHTSDDLFKMRKIYLYPIKFIQFFLKCASVSTVVINPSFERNSLLRDTLYLFISKKIFKRRTIIFWHGWVEDFEEDVKRSRIYKYILRKYYSAADQTILLNTVFKRKLIGLGYPKSHDFQLSSVAADDSSLHSFCIEEKFRDITSIRLLFLSRVISEKGIFRVIEIMDKLINHKQIKNVELLVAGDGEDIIEAKSLVQELRLQQHIKFLGFVKDVEKHQILSEAHILILPTSYIEGMPVSILEAMLFGLFILASSKGGIIDLVGTENGTLIDENDTDSYVNRIVELIQDKDCLKNTGVHNHYYSVQKYASSVVRKKLYQVFTKQEAS